MYGYQGRILHIDLSTDRHWEEPLSPAVLRSFVGGIGLGTYLLYRYGPAGAEPLAPESPLILATSPFVGTAITTSAKFAVVARSPLTGMIGDSLSSSHLAIELKRTGYDALVIRGACPDWRVLRIVDGEVELADATTLIGLDTDATEAALESAGIDGLRHPATTAPYAPYDLDYLSASWMERYFRSFAGTIAGGTSEIQRNIIARGLGMPMG